MSECVECGTSDGIVQHHTNYAEDVTVPLCQSCHTVVHKSHEHHLKPVDENPKGKTKIEVHSGTFEQLKADKPRGVTWDRFLLDLNEARPAVNGTVVG